ncbi:IclR family transcriptional regulator [Rhodococcus sp. (in: high G+C Gram-positive bacteria)]|uniref:IclR family transcriptional regulator n=1 Tax=Rhodococcus sp. TaxID=1831 RepID=UPI003BB62AE9
MTVVDRPVGSSTMSKQDEPQSMIARMTRILDAFDGGTAQLTLEDLELRTGLPRSTVHRILDQLIRLEWVDRAPLGYRPGRRSRGTNVAPAHDRIRAAAAPVLHRLALQTGCVAHLTVLDGRDSVYLDKVGGRLATALPTRVGGRRPVHANAGGKAMLTWLAPESVDGLFAGGLSACTDRTIADLGVLHSELGRIRKRRGLAFESGESVTGVACVGAAVRAADGPVAGISLCGTTEAIRLDRVGPLVAAAAHHITRELYPGTEPDSPPRARFR